MTFVAVVLCRKALAGLLGLPVAGEARGVAGWNGFEDSFFRRDRPLSSADLDCDRRALIRLVTGRAVINRFRRRLIKRIERRGHEIPLSIRILRWLFVASNHSLVLAVREVTRKLARHLARFGKLLHIARGQSRAGARVTDCTDGWVGAFEKLLTMTTDA